MTTVPEGYTTDLLTLEVTPIELDAIILALSKVTGYLDAVAQTNLPEDQEYKPTERALGVMEGLIEPLLDRAEEIHSRYQVGSE